tara:strand:- start:25 stop:279 length:255 start_codon:yes stop_codon:yes gene_type:complete
MFLSFWSSPLPPFKKKFCAEDDASLVLTKCILCLHTGNYEKARSIARKAEDTSNLDTDEDNSDRKRRAPFRLLSESDSDAGKLF